MAEQLDLFPKEVEKSDSSNRNLINEIETCVEPDGIVVIHQKVYFGEKPKIYFIASVKCPKCGEKRKQSLREDYRKFEGLRKNYWCDPCRFEKTKSEWEEHCRKDYTRSFQDALFHMAEIQKGKSKDLIMKLGLNIQPAKGDI